MIRSILVLVLILFNLQDEGNKIIARQGQVSFFSYTAVENIKAENNQALCIINLDNAEIAVSMLMNAFIFEKALMKEHFNESYIESDIYPKASFSGKILDFDSNTNEEQIRIVQGTFTMHGVSKELEIKTKIEKTAQGYFLTGTFKATVDDYKIKVPPLLAGNIAETISVDFRFEFKPYED